MNFPVFIFHVWDAATPFSVFPVQRGEVEMFPDAWTVFEQTAPIYMHGMIFGAMTESFCAEQSARMTAMDSATKSAKDMIHDLELEYNRSRQGSITQEITEIIGGAAAVQNNE